MSYTADSPTGAADRLLRPAPTPGEGQRFRLAALLGPALLLIAALYLGGLALALAQSLGYLPAAGMTHISLDAYRAIFARPDFYSGLLLTAWVSLASTAASVLVAIPAALLLRNLLGNRRWVAILYQLNLPLPHTIGALGVLLLLSQSGLLARLAYALGRIGAPSDFPALVFDSLGIGIILEYTWKASVFTGVILLAALHSIDEDYEATASTLGANAWQRFRYVTLPLLRPSLISASVLVFAFAFGGYEVPYLLGQRSPSMLPVMAYREYSRVDLTARPEAMALSVFIAGVASLLAWAYMRLGER